MDEKDSLEVFVENMKKAASLTKDLGVAQPENKPMWDIISEMITTLRQGAQKMYVSRPLSPEQVIIETDNWAKAVGMRDKLDS